MCSVFGAFWRDVFTFPANVFSFEGQVFSGEGERAEGRAVRPDVEEVEIHSFGRLRTG